MKNVLCLIALIFFAVSAKAQTLLTERNFDGIRISGEEYWVFDDDRPGSPYAQNRIIWSYSQAPKNSQQCGKIAYEKLTKWLKDKNSSVYKVMKAYKDAGGVSRIYLWVNDYTKAPKQSLRPRKSKYWLWENSYFKFESTLMPDGTCHTPTEGQIVNYVNAKLVARGLSAFDPEGDLSYHSRDAIGNLEVNNSSRGGFWAGIKRFFGFGGSSSSSGGSGSSQ